MRYFSIVAASAAVSGVVLMAGYASAAATTNGGISGVWAGGIEATQTLDTVNSTSGFFGANTLSQANQSPGFNADGLNTSNAIAALGFVGAADEAKDFGGLNADTVRGTISMSLTGMVLNNVTGDDLYVTEAGGNGGPEAYMMRVSTNGGTSWSSWVYNQSQVQYDPDGNSNAAFITGFDFVGDFGLGSSAQVNLIQLQNAIAADTVTGSGQGTVILGGGSGNTLTAGSLNSGGDIAYAASRFDADLGYVFFASASAIPEPASLSLLGLGALGLIRRRRAV